MSKWRDKKEKIILCNAWYMSKLTKAEFCRQNNIKAKTFYKWIDKLKDDGNSKDKTTNVKEDVGFSPLKFIAVDNPIAKQNTVTEKSFIEITLPNKINFKVYLFNSAVNDFLKELLQWK